MGTDKISHITSGINVTHSLELLINARLCLILIRDSNMPLEQGDWQSALSGEEVLINIRGKTPYSHKWLSPMLGIGTCLTYKNDAGSVDRRVILFKKIT